MNYEGKMDKECIELCDAMNMIPGIHTSESCCGHGKSPYQIWFRANNLEVLPRLLYYFEWCHCGFPGWKIIVNTDCAMSPVYFHVEGPTGDAAYGEAILIAGLLRGEVEGDAL